MALIFRSNDGDDVRARRMGSLDAHPSVVSARERPAAGSPAAVSLEEIRDIARRAGADDASCVSEKSYALAAMPSARSFVAIVQRTLPDNIRSPKRSVANLDFHRTGRELDEVARRVAEALNERGHAAMNPPMAFPMEMSEFPGRT